MKYLIVDGCASKSYVAIANRQSPLDIHYFDSYCCTETLFTTFKKIFTQHPLDTFTFISVCKGPGSFTNTRITLMSIKSFSYIKKKPVITFDSHIPLRSNEFKNQSILSNETKTGATLSTGGKTPNYISLRDLEETPPLKLIRNPPYNFQVLTQYLEEKAAKKQFSDPLTLTALYLKNP